MTPRRSARAAIALPVLLLLLAGCGGDEKPDTPSATVPSTTERTTTTTTAPQTPEQEVEAAYLKSWDVYTKAMRELDPSELEKVYAGDALELRRNEIADYKAANTPAAMDVEHHYVIDVYGEGRAVVTDAYLNKSVFVDPVTGEPTEPVPNEIVRTQYELRLAEGKWRVVAIIDRS